MNAYHKSQRAKEKKKNRTKRLETRTLLTAKKTVDTLASGGPSLSETLKRDIRELEKKEDVKEKEKRLNEMKKRLRLVEETERLEREQKAERVKKGEGRKERTTTTRSEATCIN